MLNRCNALHFPSPVQNKYQDRFLKGQVVPCLFKLSLRNSVLGDQWLL